MTSLVDLTISLRFNEIPTQRKTSTLQLGNVAFKPGAHERRGETQGLSAVTLAPTTLCGFPRVWSRFTVTREGSVFVSRYIFIALSILPSSSEIDCLYYVGRIRRSCVFVNGILARQGSLRMITSVPALLYVA